MKRRLIIPFLLSISLMLPCFSYDLYILNDRCSGSFYEMCDKYFKDYPEISLIRDVRGVDLRISLDIENTYEMKENVKLKLNIIKHFLAKIKNPVIIEVHTLGVPKELSINNWEYSTVLANKISDVFTKGEQRLPVERVKSVGYGEFMPSVNNTSNNGGKDTERVDIIILCSIDGE